MSSKFIKVGIVIPLIAAVVVGVISFFSLRANVDAFSPFPNGSEGMYFDNLNEGGKEVSENELDSLKGGELLGTFKGKEELNLRYESGYSSLLNNASLSKKGALLNEGTAYAEILSQNKKKLSDDMTFSGVFGDIKYKKTGEKTVKNENDVFLTTKRSENLLVVYCRHRDKAGLSPKYDIIIYEEAK